MIGALFDKDIKVGQFIKMGSSTFMGVTVEEDLYGFFDKIEKIFWVMKATNTEGVNLMDYHLKDFSYQWYEEWDRDKG